MQFNASRSGVERTYIYTPGGIEVVCADLDTAVIVEMAKHTGWTHFLEPGARSSTIRPEICALLDDLEELRALASDHPAEREARQDVLEADLEQHLYGLRTRLHRVAHFGAYRPGAAADPDRTVPFSGEAVPVGGELDRRSACLVMVIAPAKVRRCRVVINPKARR
jgi:hypothetical protein